MLYSNFVKKAREIDPSFDENLIDRTLEPNEALGELQRRRHIQVQSSEPDMMKQWRESLFDMGIKHPSMQNFVVRQEKPPAQEDMDMLSYIMGARPERNWKMDMKRKAKPARTVKQYAKNPNRYDVAGVDTPGSNFNSDWF